MLVSFTRTLFINTYVLVCAHLMAWGLIPKIYPLWLQAQVEVGPLQSKIL